MWRMLRLERILWIKIFGTLQKLTWQVLRPLRWFPLRAFRSLLETDSLHFSNHWLLGSWLKETLRNNEWAWLQKGVEGNCRTTKWHLLSVFCSCICSTATAGAIAMANKPATRTVGANHWMPIATRFITMDVIATPWTTFVVNDRVRFSLSFSSAFSKFLPSSKSSSLVLFLLFRISSVWTSIFLCVDDLTGWALAEVTSKSAMVTSTSDMVDQYQVIWLHGVGIPTQEAIETDETLKFRCRRRLAVWLVSCLVEQNENFLLSLPCYPCYEVAVPTLGSSEKPTSHTSIVMSMHRPASNTPSLIDHGKQHVVQLSWESESQPSHSRAVIRRSKKQGNKNSSSCKRTSHRRTNVMQYYRTHLKLETEENRERLSLSTSLMGIVSVQ